MSTVLISGASIAGPALAFWLRRHGFDVTVVEKSHTLRGGGYPIDIRGTALGGARVDVRPGGAVPPLPRLLLRGLHDAQPPRPQPRGSDVERTRPGGRAVRGGREPERARLPEFRPRRGPVRRVPRSPGAARPGDVDLRRRRLGGA